MDTLDSQLKVLVKGASIVLFGVFMSKVLSYLYRLAVARIGPAEYGLVSIGLVFFELAVMISLLGVDQGVLRFVPQYIATEDKSNLKGIIRFSLLMASSFGILLSILLFLFSNNIAIAIFHDVRLSIVLKIISFAIPFGAMRSILANVMRAFKKVEYDVGVRFITENAIKLALVIVLIYSGYSYVGAAIASVIAVIATAGIFLAILQTKFRKLYVCEKAKYAAGPLLHYSVPLLFNAVIILLAMWTDTLLLGYFHTVNEVGVYNAASPTAQLMYMFPAMILSLFLPVLVDVHTKNNQHLFAQIYKTITKWIFVINFGLLAIMIMFSGKILSTFFGANYIAGSLALVILASGYFIYHLALTSNNVILVLNKTRLLFIISFCGLVVNLVLNILLIPKYNILGASIATSVAFITMAVITFIITYKLVHINLFDIQYLKVLISTIVAATTTLFLMQYILIKWSIILLLIGCAIFATIYITLLLFTKSFNREDFLVLDWFEAKTGICLTRWCKPKE